MIAPGCSASAWMPRAPSRRSRPTAKSTLAVFACPYDSHLSYGRRSKCESSKSTGAMWWPRELTDTTRSAASRAAAPAQQTRQQEVAQVVRAELELEAVGRLDRTDTP